MQGEKDKIRIGSKEIEAQVTTERSNHGIAIESNQTSD
jgi:hypothetical protein